MFAVLRIQVYHAQATHSRLIAVTRVNSTLSILINNGVRISASLDVSIGDEHRLLACSFILTAFNPTLTPMMLYEAEVHLGKTRMKWHQRMPVGIDTISS